MTIRFLGAALALASLISPTIAASQVADRAGAPSGTAPLQAPCVVQDNGTCAAVQASVPLPTQMQDSTPVATSSTSSAATVFSVDTTGFRGLTFSLYGSYTLGTQTECSNDNAAWVACQVLDTNSNSYTSGPNSQSRAYYAPAVSRYFRLRVSSYTSGTLNAVAFLRQTNIDPGNITISGNPGVQGVTAVGNTAAGSPLRNGCVSNNTTPTARANGAIQDVWCTQFGAPVVAIGDYQSGNFAPLQAGSIQAKSATTTGLPVDANLRSYNVLTNAWLRILDANTAAGAVGDGLLGVGNLGWDGAAWQRQRLTAGGGLLVADQDGVAIPFTPGGAINAILFSTPTTGYAGVSFQANGSWSGTVSIEGSNDASADCQTGGTWFGLTSMNLNGGNPSTTINGNTGLFIPAATTCARARVSGYNSGSFTGVAVLRSLTPLPSTTQVNNYKAQFNSEVNNASVAASAAKINYSTRDLGGGTVNYSRFTCYFDPGVASAGALGHIEGSPDNSNWTPLLPPVDLSTVTPVTRESRVFYRYNRCAFTNGSAAQTGLYVASQYGD